MASSPRDPILPDDWALCVGIGSYLEDGRLVPLPGATRDARRFHRWVTAERGGGVPADRAVLVLSPQPQDEVEPEPTADRIESWFRGLHRIGAKSRREGRGFRIGRRLWLYFSGHGLDFGDRGATGLLTAEALPPETLEHVVGREWAEYFRRARAFEEVVLFMDCCRSQALRVPPRLPPWKQQKAAEPARFFYGLAVAEGDSAREIEIDGEPAGQFTHALLTRLEDVALRPLTARQLGALLFEDCGELGAEPDLDWPRNPKHDFVLVDAAGGAGGVLPGRRSPVLRGPVRGGPLGFELEVTAADELARLRLVAPATASHPGSFLKEGWGRLLAGSLPAGRYAVLASLGGARSETPIDVVVDRRVALAALPLRTPAPLDGGAGWTAEELAELRQVDGTGAAIAVVCRGLADATALADARPLGGPRRAGGRAVQLWAAEPGRRLLRLPAADGGNLVVALPARPAWRTEVYVEAGRDALPPALSIRMLPAELGLGAAMPSDRRREGLRARLERFPRTALDPGELDLRSGAGDLDLRADPVAALLAASLEIRKGHAPPARWVDAAAGVLGDDDVDVALLRGPVEAEVPPLMAAAWARGIERRELSTVEGSVADELAGRRLHAGPWLAWDSDPRVGTKGWLGDVAASLWPGWSVEPDPRNTRSWEAAARRLGAPAASVRRRTYKSPPIGRLVRHSDVAFVGASNDQLAASLAIAFSLRDRRRWRRLAIWFLDDARLSQMTSDGRSGAPLARARNRAQRQLAGLLDTVARSWRVLRYDVFEVEGRWTFASLWDWREPGGYVHASPYRSGEDVRVTGSTDEEWPIGSPRPRRYAAVAEAYEALSPTAVVAASD